jgi:hypothetical protein
MKPLPFVEVLPKGRGFISQFIEVLPKGSHQSVLLKYYPRAGVSSVSFVFSTPAKFVGPATDFAHEIFQISVALKT